MITREGSKAIVNLTWVAEELKKAYNDASPYTGEYWMGRADLLNDLLGNPEIDWNKHPRSIQSLHRKASEENV